MKKLVNLFLISAACLLAFACAKDGEEGSAAGTAVLGVPGIFPQQRRGVFHLLLRLLPARGIHPRQRYVH